jgi:ABC-type Mn2+/Zn2+ transport system permease subunit
MGPLLEPLEYDLLQRAFAEAVLMGAVCGLLGVLVLLRGLAYTGESLSHALLPGAAVALAIGVPAAGGAVVGAVAAALLVALVARRPDVGEDAAVAVVLPAAFAAGVVVIAVWGTGRDLDSLLFGNILGVDRADLVLAGGALALTLAVLAVAGRRLVLTAFDRPFARATGARPELCDALLLAALALALAVALRGVGTLLVLALLIAPAATARLLVDRVSSMLWLAPLLGVVSGVAGLELSYHADLAAGSSVAMVALGLFALALPVRPARRLLRPAIA